THAFTLHIGLPRSENLYQIKKGNHGISKTLAETIHRFYPPCSVGWWISGEQSKYRYGTCHGEGEDPKMRNLQAVTAG
ncbi:MAG: hypothetical protein LUD68_08550, partial [Rikenellaceae bacterium]|nr:hypothetical protein [Rikenellaceae bacterium]